MSKLKLSVHQLFVRSASVHPQREPELERIHPPRPLCAQFEIIERDRALVAWHVRRADGECLLQSCGMGSENHACRERHSQPLMRVYGDGIAKLNPANQVAMTVRKDGGGSVRPVQVQPQAVTF